MKSLASIQMEIDLRARELDELIDTLEDTVRKLQRRGYKIYEEDNPEYFLTGNVKFDRNKMAFMFETDKELM